MDIFLIKSQSRLTGDFLLSHSFMPRTFLFFIAGFLFSCNQQTKTDQIISPDMIINDPRSYSKPNEAVVKHLTLNISVDFEKKILWGEAALDIEVKNNAKEIILDTRDLEIFRVVLDDSTESKFTLGAADKILGSSLTIPVKPSTKKLTVHYGTS